jgi:pentatricopeptide repeat protein
VVKKRSRTSTMKSSLSIQPKEVGFYWAMWLLFSPETSIHHSLSGRLAVHGLQPLLPSLSSSLSQPFCLRSSQHKQSGTCWASSHNGWELKMSSTNRKSPYSDSPRNPNKDEGNQRKATERKRQRQRRDGPTPPQHKISLNSEIHGLRRERNGIPLAEQRLQAAIEEMLKEVERNPDLPRVLLFPPQAGTEASSVEQQEVGTTVRTDDGDDVGVARSRFPDAVSFNSIITSHAKNAAKDRFAAHRAEGWLRRMNELSSGEMGFAHLKPTTFTYNAVMEAYFNSKQNYGGGGDNSVGFSETKRQSISRLYREIQSITCLSPTTYTRNIVLASQPTDWEDWMLVESWAISFFSENATSNASQQDPSHIGESLPDRQTFNILLKRYAEIGDADKAETLLRNLLRRYRDQKLHAEGSSLGLEPAKVWFHCVLRALAASKDASAIDSEERAGNILQEMKDLHFNDGRDDLMPDTSTYNHVMNIHAHCGNVEEALHLLQGMEDAFDSSGIENQQPDCVTYTTMIKAYATVQQNKSLAKETSSVDPAESGMGILKRMRKRSIEPSIVTCK